jgi:parallel beta-helix repeat protein
MSDTRKSRVLWTISLTFIVVFFCPFTYGKVIYVNDDATWADDGTSWADAYNYLQEALADANSAEKPVEVRVARGVYMPDQGANQTTADRDATFRLINGVTLKGGYAGSGEPEPDARDILLYQTVLTGDLAGDDIDWNELLDIRDQNWGLDEPNREDNTYHVVIGSYTDETAVLDGFTIAGGTAYYPESSGGGIYIDAGSPTVTNCTFTRNWAYESGGGMYCENNSNPTLTNCILSRNWALYCGGMYNSNSNPSLTNCTFTENFAAVHSGIIVERGYRQYGGMVNSRSNPTLINCSFIENLDVGMCNSQSSPTLTNCSFIGNLGFYGGGMFNYSDSSPILTNCIFNRNSANYGYGGGICGGSPILTNCIFSGNEAEVGGGISGGSPTMINCTLSGNRADGAGGISGGSPTLVNCIVWGNTSPQITSDASISFSNIPGNFPGEGNINADPLFVDADGEDDIFGTEDDDLRLLEGSPCIDTGDNSAVPPSLVTDLDGNPRIINDIVDMGAYENAMPNLLLSTWSVIVPEGGTAEFAVALAEPPTETVEVTVVFYSGDQDITVESRGILTFDASNYSVPQTVTLSAAEDSDNQNNRAQILITTDNGLTGILTATEADNEPNVGVLFVDDDAAGNNNGGNWADAYIDLQDALSAATESRGIEEIRVAQGIYRPDQGGENIPGDRDATFRFINRVTIKGGFAGVSEFNPDMRDIETYVTILSGDLNGDDIEVADPCDLWDEPTRSDNCYHVVICTGIDESTLIDGFTITGGNNNIDPHYNGGGIYNLSGKPIITNCIVTKNSAFFGGGGMCNSDSNPTLSNCIFTINYAKRYGGGMYNSGSDPILTNCTFQKNYAYHYGGGGMSNSYSNPTLIDCAFTGNSADGYFTEGGGMRNYISNPVLTNCIFTGNSAIHGYSAQGGGMHNDGRSGIGSNPILTNCIFTGNLARDGAGIYNLRSSHSILTNCIFSGNSAVTSGGGVRNHGSSIILTNCTFAQNSAQNGNAVACITTYALSPSYISLAGCILWDGGEEIWTKGNYSTIEIAYSDIQGGWEGEGNINLDPLFAEPENGDYHLKSEAGRWDPVSESWVHGDVTGPCIDAGDPNSPVGDEPVPNGGRINMGAYGGTTEASKSPRE